GGRPSEPPRSPMPPSTATAAWVWRRTIRSTATRSGTSTSQPRLAPAPSRCARSAACWRRP
ncbi:uncharacterized protein METZ01_LOCUS307874, partial [marine metagenome]